MFRSFTGNLKIDDRIGLCLPYGFTSQIFAPYAQQWIQAPNYLVIRYEFQNNFSRAIPLDGRPHQKDVDLAWGGDSVGHWEGNTPRHLEHVAVCDIGRNHFKSGRAGLRIC